MQSIIYYIIALVMLFPGFVAEAAFSALFGLGTAGAVAVSCSTQSDILCCLRGHRRSTALQEVTVTVVAHNFLSWLPYAMSL